MTSSASTKTAVHYASYRPHSTLHIFCSLASRHSLHQPNLSTTLVDSAKHTCLLACLHCAPFHFRRCSCVTTPQTSTQRHFGRGNAGWPAGEIQHLFQSTKTPSHRLSKAHQHQTKCSVVVYVMLVCQDTGQACFTTPACYSCYFQWTSTTKQNNYIH